MTVSQTDLYNPTPANPFGLPTRNNILPAPRSGQHQFERMAQWLDLFMRTAEVAKVLARTAFVPDAMRGKPEDIAAAMMRSLELGIDPLDGLANLNVIKGKVGYSAEFMRRRILEAGHEFEFLEQTDDRCRIRGRRNGATEWQTFTFTADQARKAKIPLTEYPGDKLVARASSRMCRRIFPDVLAGAEILEDVIDVGGETIVDAGSGAVQRKRRPRKTPVKPPEPEQTKADTPEYQAYLAEQESDIDDLLDDGLGVSYTDRLADLPPLRPEYENVKVEVAAEQKTAAPADPPAEWMPDPDEPPKPTPADPTRLNRRMHVLFGKADCTDREDQIIVIEHITGQHIQSRKDLTPDQTQKLVDQLGAWERADELGQKITDILNIAAIREAENETGIDA